MVLLQPGCAVDKNSCTSRTPTSAAREVCDWACYPHAESMSYQRRRLPSMADKKSGVRKRIPGVVGLRGECRVG